MICNLVRAIAQAGAHLCNAIVEAIDARRPMHDEPLTEILVMDDTIRAEVDKLLLRSTIIWPAAEWRRP